MVMSYIRAWAVGDYQIQNISQRIALCGYAQHNTDGCVVLCYADIL